jgi:hypothetical protein
MKIFVVIIFIFLSSNLILCQKLSSDNSIDSVSENYFSYTRSNFSIGWQSQFKPLIINKRVTLSLSYTISSFFYSLEESKNQIGLFNEIGVNNMSVYIQAGPEIRLLENIYIVPKIGVSFAWLAGVERGGIGFLYFYGGNIGYIYSLKENLSFYFEGGADFIPIEETQGIYFGRVGVAFKLF